MQRRNRARNFWALLAVFALMLGGAAACGGDDDDGGGGSASGEVETDFGVTDSTITLGQLTDETGPFAGFGKPITAGQEAYFKALNAAGGIAGRNVETVVRNHGYNEQNATQQYAEISEQVLMLSQLLGTPMTLALKQTLEEDEMLASPASLASNFAADSQLVMIGTPYRMEMINAVQYVVDEMQMPDAKVAHIYINSDYGLDGNAGVKDGVEANDGLELVADIGYAPSPTKTFAEEVDQLRSSGAQVVFLTTSPGDTAKIVGVGAQRTFTPQYIGNSPSFHPALLQQQQLAPVLQKLVKTSSSSAYWAEDVPGMPAFLDAAKEFAPDFNATSDPALLFGWQQAMVVHAVLEKAVDDGDLTRAGVIKAFGELSEVDMEGMQPPLTYGDTPDTRVPSRQVRIFEIVIGDAAYPGGLKPATEYFESEAAKDAQIKAPSSE